MRVAPIVIWVALQTLRVAGVNFVTQWRAFPQVSSEIADEWTSIAIESGMPMSWERPLRSITYVTAFVMNVVGWIILSHLTVWLFGLIF
jgi:hypothetical protein